VRLLGQLTNLRREMSDPSRPSHHQDCEPVLVEPEPAAERLLLAWGGRTEAKVDRQAQQLDAVRGDAPTQSNPSRTLGRRDHQVRLAERPPSVEVHEIGDHRHQRSRASAAPDRLMRNMVEERVDREHDVRVVLLQQM